MQKNVNSIYIRDKVSCQVDPLLELGLDRSSLDRLRKIITEIRANDGNDVAFEITRWLADQITLSQFINTIFLHATNGYVQFRMFIDGQHKDPWAMHGRQRQSQTGSYYTIGQLPSPAKRRYQTIRSISAHPLHAHRPKKARIEDTCEGVAIMVECDHQPVLSQQVLVYVLGTPTLVIKSGGVWIDPETQEQQDKVHLYWRLAQPTRETADHDKLREARELASLIVAPVIGTAREPPHPDPLRLLRRLRVCYAAGDGSCRECRPESVNTDIDNHSLELFYLPIIFQKPPAVGVTLPLPPPSSPPVPRAAAASWPAPRAALSLIPWRNSLPRP
jgi:hypothetical protein